MAWDPFEQMRRMQREIDRLFSDMLGEKGYRMSDKGDLVPVGMRGRMQEYREPLADVWENDKDVVVTLELPGINKKDIELHVKRDRLDVKVEHEEESKTEKEGMVHMERAYKGFYRSLMLPSEVDAEKAKAEYKDGVLEIKIPKKESAKKKRITVD